MKKKLIIISLVLIGLATIPLAWYLFPWAQSISAETLSDGSKVLVSMTAGSWIITLGNVFSGISFLAAIIVGVYYQPQNKTPR
ncbi:MAG: hypothetical protein OEY96_14150 [Gammaproteobacteria bacterium]|nr:hypothetical protein [Gammaproteobacteria bacterium]